jgi:hypothetical protein
MQPNLIDDGERRPSLTPRDSLAGAVNCGGTDLLL